LQSQVFKGLLAVLLTAGKARDRQVRLFMADSLTHMSETRTCTELRGSGSAGAHTERVQERSACAAQDAGTCCRMLNLDPDMLAAQYLASLEEGGG
jgi:hypothetical protein